MMQEYPACLPVYQYHTLPLGFFRLIRILPKESRSKLHNSPESLVAELVECAFDDPFPYEAVSYCWSGPNRILTDADDERAKTFDHHITIIDSPATSFLSNKSVQTQESIIKINCHLHTALYQLQELTELPLFVDQICINQADNIEKSRIVQRMGDIYCLARRVLGWLGPISPEAQTFMDFVESMRHEKSTAFCDLNKHDFPELNQIRAYVAALIPPSDTSVLPKALREACIDLRALSERILPLLCESEDARKKDEIILPVHGFIDVLARQWFGRMWVIQEACLSDHLVLVCGGTKCEAKHFEKVLLLAFFSIQRAAVSIFLEVKNTSGRTDKKKVLFSADDLTFALALARFVMRLFGVRRTLQDQSDGGGSRDMSHKENSSASRLSLLQLLTRFNAIDVAATHLSTISSSRWQTYVTIKKYRASDPRDCYYALLGLVRSNEPAVQANPVDYGLPVAQVYTQLAAALMRHGDMDTVLFSRRDRKKLKGLPSWVPDWSADMPTPHSYFDSKIALFKAGITKSAGVGDVLWKDLKVIEEAKKKKGHQETEMEVQEIEEEVSKQDENIIRVRATIINSIVRVGEYAYDPTLNKTKGIWRSYHYFLAEVKFFLGLRRRDIAITTTAAIKTNTGNMESTEEEKNEDADLAGLIATGGRGLSISETSDPLSRLGPQIDGTSVLAAAFKVEHEKARKNAQLEESIEYFSRFKSVLSNPQCRKSSALKYWTWLPLWLRPFISSDWQSFEFFEKWRVWETHETKVSEDRPRLEGELLEAVEQISGLFGTAVESQADRKCWLGKGGKIGLGPRDMVEGDLVVVIQGVSVPVVLRDRGMHSMEATNIADRDNNDCARSVEGRKGKWFEFIGEAYAHEFMDGEAIVDPRWEMINLI